MGLLVLHIITPSEIFGGAVPRAPIFFVSGEGFNGQRTLGDMNLLPGCETLEEARAVLGLPGLVLRYPTHAFRLLTVYGIHPPRTICIRTYSQHVHLRQKSGRLQALSTAWISYPP